MIVVFNFHNFVTHNDDDSLLEFLNQTGQHAPGFLKSLQCGYMCVCVCVRPRGHE